MAYATTSTPPVTTDDLESARQSLAAHIDAITDRVSPGGFARRQSRKLRRLVKSDEGSLNTRNVAIAAGVVTVLLVYAIRRRSL
jgi:Protein of unknown function (DUF3618)